MVVCAGNKEYRFCDKHASLVLSEDNAQMKRSRRKVGMALPGRINGRVLSHGYQGYGARCCHDGCGRRAAFAIYTARYPRDTGGAPACMEHYRTLDDSKWGGVWYAALDDGRLDRVELVDTVDVQAQREPLPEHEDPVDEQAATLAAVFDEDNDDLDTSAFIANLVSKLEAGELED